MHWHEQMWVGEARCNPPDCCLPSLDLTDYTKIIGAFQATFMNICAKSHCETTFRPWPITNTKRVFVQDKNLTSSSELVCKHEISEGTVLDRAFCTCSPGSRNSWFKFVGDHPLSCVACPFHDQQCVENITNVMWGLLWGASEMILLTGISLRWAVKSMIIFINSKIGVNRSCGLKKKNRNLDSVFAK